MGEDRVWETIRGQGRQVVDELKRLVHEGNVRRVVVRQGDRVVAEFPVTVGVVGALAAPVVAAIGALVALLAECRIDVEKEATRQPAGKAAPAPAARKPRKRRVTRKP
jgi:hypothetical protein